MKYLVVLCLSLAAIMSAQPKPNSQSLPPLIDRELLFGNPEIAGAQLSPDGKFIAFLKPWKDTRNIWVKKTSEPFSAARLLTTETKRPVPVYFWTRDGKYILYVKDNDGDENFNLYAVDPAGANAAGAEAPASRDLTGLKGIQIQLYSAPKKDPDTAYIGINDRDKAWHDLYKLKLSTGEKTLIRKNTDRIGAWYFDLDGQLRLARRVADNGDQEILRADASGFTKIYSCNMFEGCDVLRFNKDGKRVYIETNKGDGVNLSALTLLDVATGKTELVESDPLKRVDLGGAVFTEATDELAQTNYVDDKVRHYFKNKDYEAGFKWLEAKFPGKQVNVVNRTKDDALWLVAINSDTEPGETYIFDSKTQKVTFQYKIREKLDRTWLASMEPIHYKSSDGLEIPAYLTLPKGLPAKNLPTLVIPHGGPWARDGWGFNPLAQFFANRGYAVLMPNFRGSTGYGKQFLNAGNGEWGKKMQDDITWGVQHLIKEGVADPKRVGILGGSYGGYATLAGVAFTPDLYKAAVDIVGPSNLLTLIESIPPYWESERKLMYARMADPATPQGKAWMEDRSPLNSANKIKTALFVVQGANDPRVNRREAEQIVVALRDRGFPVEYMLAPDEGHGFARPVNNMAMFMATEKFLAKYLDGRYQEGGTPEVVKRLAEITVDPKTVVVTKKTDAAAVTTLPKLTADLKPGVHKYESKLKLGMQELAIKSSTEVREEDGAWVATETSQNPMGTGTDAATLQKGTLAMTKRSVKQGPVAIDFELNGGKVTGKLNVPGQERPINADLDGPVFPDGSAGWLAIGCLPLADGYSTQIRNFDLMKAKVKIMDVKVAGSESVTTPAGTFETYKVELTAADGGSDQSTVWIAKQTRVPVKINAVITSMQGAQMSSELVQ